MKKQRQRIVSIVLCMMLVIGSMPMLLAHATGGTCGDGVTWSLENGVLTIGGAGAMDDYDPGAENTPWYGESISNIVIGNGVTHLGEWAFGFASASSVSIPSTVTEIGNSAFAGSCLESVTIPGSVESWPEAFVMCTSLTTATILSGVEALDTMCFGGCSSLQNVTIPSTVTAIGQSAFHMCSSLTSITLPENLESIGGTAFASTGLAEIEIPDSVTSIGEEAFSATALTEVTLPSGLTTIADGLFYGCSLLESVSIPDGVTEIGYTAFCGCEALESLHIPASVLTIQDSAFEDCTNLSYLCSTDANGAAATYAAENGIDFVNCANTSDVTWTIENGVLTISGSGAIPEYAFSELNPFSITEVIVESGVTSIPMMTFQSFYSLERATLPSGLTVLSDGLFASCTALTEVNIPNTVTTISDAVFNGCTSLESITIPDGVTTIRRGAFGGCTSLESVVLPDSVETVESEAFAGCDSLVFVHFPAGVQTIGEYAFGEYAISGDISFYICSESSDGAAATYAAANGINFVTCTGHGDDEEAPTSGSCGDHLTWTLENGVLTISGEGAMTDFDNPVEGPDPAPWTLRTNEITSIVVETGVTTIGDNAFYCIDYTTEAYWMFVDEPDFCAVDLCPLQSVSLPAGLTSLGDYAFFGNAALQTLSIPDSVTSIGEYAFSGCGLTNIAIPAGVTSIEPFTFYDCRALAQVTLREGLTSIGQSAFLNCYALENIHIPESVVSFGTTVFTNCTSLAYICAESSDGAAATYAAANGISFQICTGHDAGVPLASISGTIEDDIVVNFLVAGENLEDAQVVTITYSDYNGSPVTDTYTDFTSVPVVDGQYRFSIDIAPAQMGDTITINIDGETRSTSFKAYCETLLDDPQYGALAAALLQYGEAVRQATPYAGSPIASLDGLDPTEARGLTNTFSTTIDPSKFISATYLALIVPEYRFYMDITEEEAAAYNNGQISVTGCDHAAAQFVRTPNGIALEVTGVFVEEMDQVITVNIQGLGQITFSGYDFARMFASNTSTELFGAAMYNYGKAAVACFAPAQEG